jgi:hypothetical protein
MILLYLTLTFCPITVPVPNGQCSSSSRYCTVDACADFIREGKPGHRLVGMMATEARK